MTWRPALLCLGTLLLLAGCDSGGGGGCDRDGGSPLEVAAASWPKFRKDLANTGSTDAVVASTAAERWVFPARGSVALRNAVTAPVILANGRVLVVGGEGEFPTVNRAFVLDPSTGAETDDSFDIPLSSTAGVNAGTSPVISQTRIGIMFADGSVRQFDLDGLFTASIPASGAVNGSLTVDFEGAIYTATSNGLYSSLCASGGARWIVGIGSSEATAALFEGDPLTDKDDVSIIGSNDGKIRAFDFDARLRWQFTATAAVRASTIYDATNGLVYGADTSATGLVFALNAADGRRCRNLTTNVGAPVVASPAYANNTLYVVDSAGILHALAITAACDPSSATPPVQLVERWTYDSQASVSSSPAVAVSPTGDPVVVFGTDDGTVHAVADLGDTGSALWTHCTAEGGAVGRSSVAIGADGTVYVTTLANRIYAIAAGDGESVPCSAIATATATVSPSPSPSPTIAAQP